MAGKHKVRTGRVISDKMDKTVVVQVDVAEHHPLYHKTIRNAVKYKVHDENKESKVGDVVRIIETRPISRDKRWRVAEIITKGEVVEVKPSEIGVPTENIENAEDTETAENNEDKEV